MRAAPRPGRCARLGLRLGSNVGERHVAGGTRRGGKGAVLRGVVANGGNAEEVRGWSDGSERHAVPSDGWGGGKHGLLSTGTQAAV